MIGGQPAEVDSRAPIFKRAEKLATWMIEWGRLQKYPDDEIIIASCNVIQGAIAAPMRDTAGPAFERAMGLSKHLLTASGQMQYKNDEITLAAAQAIANLLMGAHR